MPFLSFVVILGGSFCLFLLPSSRIVYIRKTYIPYSPRKVVCMTQLPSLAAFLESHAESEAPNPAVVFNGQRIGYGDLNQKANLVARFLMGNHIAVGDRVILLSDNSINFIIAYYGIIKSGGVAIPLNTGFGAQKITGIIKETGAKALIVSSRYERLIQETYLLGTPLPCTVIERPALSWGTKKGAVWEWDDILGESNSSNPLLELDRNDLCNIIYTSGSTGIPKGVMLTHRNLTANTHSICKYLRLTPQDIQMAVLPFYYVMGLSLLNTHIACGGTVVINNQFAFPAAVLNQMIAENVTGFSGVPATYAYLLHRSPLLKYREKLTSLRYCSQAGGHMSSQIKKQLRDTLPTHTDIVIMYGATEASARLTYLDPKYYTEKIDSIGKAIPGVTLCVLDKEGKQLPPGAEGELVATGHNIMKGYFNDADGTREVLDHNGYHTGDVGYMDKDGFFYITGRKDNLLKVGGHRINPQEIEDVLMSTGLLVEVAVLGVPDKLMVHKLRAIGVAIDTTTTEKDILAKASQSLPRYKIPESVKLVRMLPKKGSGKVDREACLRMVG
ncbi:MAG: AMP-binding protein [Chitinivibrionales bacterium]|nr:AMP-binding protein [Chitinivibrionales bacterium]